MIEDEFRFDQESVLQEHIRQARETLVLLKIPGDMETEGVIRRLINAVFVMARRVQAAKDATAVVERREMRLSERVEAAEARLRFTKEYPTEEGMYILMRRRREGRRVFTLMYHNPDKIRRQMVYWNDPAYFSPRKSDHWMGPF